jgi:hypothetical protein
MRLCFLLFAFVLMAPAGRAEAQPASSPGAAASKPEDGQPFSLPVSVERIREALERTPEQPLFDMQYPEPDFRVEIDEWRRMQDILESLDFRTAPPPPGGLYGYEQQRLTNDPLRRPLAQPYAAFNGGELITLAIQSVAIKYLGGKALNAVSNAMRARAERQAREEVTRAIVQYCAAQPDGGASLSICTRTIPPE